MATINQLISILPHSKQSAIHAVDIARKLRLPTSGNQVEARLLIRDAIRNGHTIVSNTSAGYWLSSDKSEIKQYIKSLENRADDTEQRADELKQSWNAANPINQI
ncbi:hypothetical protein EZS27_023096 [termite gut metagenome]|uniref:Uncharacterized protein n=1 Tax=termite gut metagenome TaxID=433724 RepID=A0A5J4R322_9ZZZZ